MDQLGRPDPESLHTPRLDAGIGSDGSQPAEFQSGADSTPGYGHLPQSPPQKQPESFPVARVQIRRDVFWQNVCREILMTLASAAASSSGRLGTGPSDAQSSTSPLDELFDGRMGVITSLGQRIPIADVYPVFAFSMNTDQESRTRSTDVQCTVFRITTPTGESYTLPIHQIVGVHSLSQSLIEQLEAGEDPEQLENDTKLPFGFGAYTSLAQSELREDEEPGEPPTSQD